MKKLNENLKLEIVELVENKPQFPVETQNHSSPNETVPPNKLYGSNLKKLKSFKNIRKTAKMNNLKFQFIKDLYPILLFLPPADENNDLDDDILVQVMELAEQHFFYGEKEEREQLKLESVVEIMLPYFRNDDKILEKAIKNVSNRVKKLSKKDRLCKKFKVFFCINLKKLVN